MAAFYLNELLLKLTTRHDPLPELFDHYHATLEALRGGAPLEPALRLFEKRLLEILGYGLDLTPTTQSGEPHRAARRTIISARRAGLTAADAGSPGALRGRVAAGARGRSSSRARRCSRTRAGCCKAALAHCLEGRELATREVAQALVRKADLVSGPHRPGGQHRSRGDAAAGAPRALSRPGACGARLPSRPARTASRCICARTAGTSRTSDVHTLRGLLKTRMNLEMAVTDEMLSIAADRAAPGLLPGARAARRRSRPRAASMSPARCDAPARGVRRA